MADQPFNTVVILADELEDSERRERLGKVARILLRLPPLEEEENPEVLTRVSDDTEIHDEESEQHV